VFQFGPTCVDMPLPPNAQFAGKLPMDPNCHEAIALRNAIRSYEENIPGEDLRAQFVEDFPPEILFSLRLLIMPSFTGLFEIFLLPGAYLCLR
jgi:hypothetical protein